MKSSWIVALILMSAAACKRSPPPAPAAVSITETSTASPFVIARDGSAIATRDRKVWAFIEPGFDEELRRLPGVAFGDERGPKLGLLGGYFSPLIGTSTSSKRSSVVVMLSSDRAVIRFPPDLSISIFPPVDGRIHADIEGSAVILPLAADTEVRATENGAPVHAFRVSSGDEANTQVLRADHLEIESSKGGIYTVRTTCPRITTPTKRGSTSVFVVGLGQNAGFADPLYGMANAAPQDETCRATERATLSFPTP
jgi:hypothetical protein